MGMIAALDGGDIALIVLSAFWGLLVLFLCVVLINTFRVLESTKILIDVMREETIPLLREVKGSLERTNRELECVQPIPDPHAMHGLDVVGEIPFERLDLRPQDELAGMTHPHAVHLA